MEQQSNILPQWNASRQLALGSSNAIRKEVLLEARHLIASDSTLYLAEVSVVIDALEGAWLDLAWRYQGEASREAARLKLARLLLTLAHRGILDGEQLLDAAIDEMNREPARDGSTSLNGGAASPNRRSNLHCRSRDVRDH